MPETIAYESPGKWVQIIETPNKFYYLRRKGKDSVAIFLVRQNPLARSNSQDWEVLIRRQPLPIHNADLDDEQVLFDCPITGGIDGDETPIECATREAYEEAGYNATLDDLGAYFVGTQTDETVWMFWADVTGIEPHVATQDGTFFEAISENVWMKLACLDDCLYSACQIGYRGLCRTLKIPID